MAFSFSPVSRSIAEGSGTVSFTLTRTSAGATQTVYVSTVQTQGYSNSKDYLGLLNVPYTFLANETSKTITISLINDSVVEQNESFGLIAQQNASDPIGTYLAKATFTINNDDSAPATFTFSPASKSANEGSGSLSFTLSRSSAGTSQTVYVSTTQTEGYANDNDYTGLKNVPYTFLANETSKTITINLINDSIVEQNESFGLIAQQNATDPVSSYLAKATFTINNDDTASVAFSFSPASKSASEGSGSLSFTLSRTNAATSQTVYVSTIQTEGDTNDNDYTGLKNVPYTFEVNQLSKTITVNLINDSTPEQSETFGLIAQRYASDPVSAYLAKVTFTINNDDSAPVNFSFAPVSKAASEASGSLSFTLSRSNATAAQTVYVRTTETEGHVNGNDFAALNSVAHTFEVNETSKTITINLISDGVPEPNETFGLIAQQSAADPVGNYLAKATFTIIDGAGGNTAPEGADKTINVSAGSTYTLKLADFGFTDAEDSELTAVGVALGPLYGGNLTLNGANADGMTISRAEIEAGALRYASPPDTGLDYFAFTVIDSSGAPAGSGGPFPDCSNLIFNISGANRGPEASSGDGTLSVDLPASTGEYGAEVVVEPDGRLAVLMAPFRGGFDFGLTRLLPTGQPDPQIGGGTGTISYGIGAIGNSGRDLVLLPNGKYLIVKTGSFGPQGQGIEVTRLASSGQLDPTFASDGQAEIDLPGTNERGRAVLPQSDGRAVVAFTSGGSMGLLRLTANGVLDTSFGVGGIVSGPPGIALEALQQPDGKYVLLGRAPSNEGALVARFNHDGTPDGEFGTGGRVTTSIGVSFDLFSGALQPDGKIVAAGESVQDFSASSYSKIVLRYKPDGSLDNSFANGGVFALSSDGGTSDLGVAIQPDGKIVAVGYSDGDLMVLRLDVDGRLDTGFGSGGIALVGAGLAAAGHAVTVTGDGKIIVTGQTNLPTTDAFNDTQAIVARLMPDGQIDPSFAARVFEGGAPVVIDPDFWAYDWNLWSRGALVGEGGSFSASQFGSGSAAAQVQYKYLKPEGSYDGARITLSREGGANSQDVFAGSGDLVLSGGVAKLDGVNVASVSNGSGALTLTFNSNTTQERLVETLRSIAYSNTSDSPPPAVRLAWTFSDGNTGAQGGGGALSAAAVSTVFITASDTPPKGGMAEIERSGLWSELALLSRAAYAIGGGDDDSADQAMLEEVLNIGLWSPLTANKLGLAAPIGVEGLSDNGIYRNDNASALVVQSGDTVAIAFTGTDDLADWFDNVVSMYFQWYELMPLITALDRYVAASSDIKHVLVTGHSLGGALAQMYMARHDDDAAYKAVTFAAPGFNDLLVITDLGQVVQSVLGSLVAAALPDVSSDYKDDRVLHFEMDHDVVPDVLRKTGETIHVHGEGLGAHPGYLLPALGVLAGFTLTNPLSALWTSAVAALVTGGADLADKLKKFHSMDLYLEAVREIESALVEQKPSIDAGSNVLIGARQEANGSYVVGSDNDTLKDNDLAFTYELMIGGAGKDSLGGNGVNRMYGGEGDDTYEIDEVNEINADKGINEVAGAGFDAILWKPKVDVEIPPNIEKLSLYREVGWDNALEVVGNELNNEIVGNDAGNRLEGLAGDDTLDGGDGGDDLVGGPGNDALIGGDSLFGDTAVYAGLRAGYLIVPHDRGISGYEYSVSDIDLSDGDEGTDTLSSIERVQFADELVQLERTFLGFVIDGYVAGAEIYVDVNQDGVPDANEATGVYTSPEGYFSLTTALYGPLLAVGGINIDTGLPNTLSLSAPADSAVVTPLTTVVQQVVAQTGRSPTAAQEVVRDALSIPAGVDLIGYDALASDDVAVQRVATQLAVLASLAPTGSSTLSGVAAAVIDADPQAIDLTDATVLAGFAGSAPPQVIEQVAHINKSLGSAATISALSQGQGAALNSDNDAPVLLAPVADQAVTIGVPFTLSAQGVFADFDAGDTLTVTATTTAGAVLPAWLIFNTVTKTFTGNPDTAGDVPMRLTASDSSGLTTVDEFSISVTAPPAGFTRQGTSARDVVLGSHGSDVLVGLADNDNFFGLGGNDALDGGEGRDFAWYLFNRNAYQVNRGASAITISGPEGTDTLTAVERALFADGALAFDIDGNAGQTYRLYQAAFAREPDGPGLSFWIGVMDNGAGLEAVAAAFIGSAEFTGLYGANPSNEQFVTLLYQNVLNRLPDAGGLAFWVNQLNAGTITRPEVLIGFSESVENKANLLPAIGNGIAYSAAAFPAAGTAGNDQLVGTASADSFSSLAGRDLLIGLSGNDQLNGGADLDTVGYGGLRGSYTVVYNAATGGITITDTSGVDGIDALAEVERLQFADGNLAFDIAGTAGQTYRLYQAAFARTPDTPGLSFWIGQMDNGAVLPNVASQFIASAEFTAKYGANPSNGDFVTLLYQNVLNRLPDQAGLDFWVNQLDAATISRPEVLIGFSESTENQMALIGVLQQGIEYLPLG